jgi:predicted dehydrogenase
MSGVKIGIVGAGAFSPSFVKLFQAHPLVESVALADLIKERRERVAAEHGISEIYPSLDALLADSAVDSVGIFTQRHLHGPMVIRALEAGKNVYSAVPMAIDVEHVQRIIELVKQTGLIYMVGETSYYYAATVFCRKKWRAGEFGDLVYGEAQYHHDMLHFYRSYQRSGGQDWKRIVVPPMFYPTHSISMVVTVTGAYPVKVSCMGYEDQHEDGIYRTGGNQWDNPFSNETAMMRMSDGSVCRFNEMRRIGYFGANSVYTSMYGTEAGFEQNATSKAWVHLDGSPPEDVTELLRCASQPVTDATLLEELGNERASEFYFQGSSQIHDTHRLPKEFVGMHNGHDGSHQFLADDFVKAVHFHRLPPNNAWIGARCCVPGLLAHQSAMRDGEVLDVPDFGDPPPDWNVLPDNAEPET